MIKYKLVNQNRKSFAVSGHQFDDSRYMKYYEKGHITKAEPDTLGIFVFHQRKQAKKWVEKSVNRWYKILRVRPIGKGKTPKFIGMWYTVRNLNQFYSIHYCNFLTHNTEIPTGTICYPAVEVLD